MHPARNWSHRFSHAKCLSPDCSTAKSEQTPLYCRCWSLASNLILVTVSSIIRISRKYNPSSVFFYYFVTYTFTTNVKDFLNVVVISVEIVSIKLGWPKYRVHHKGKPSLYTISRNVSTIPATNLEPQPKPFHASNFDLLSNQILHSYIYNRPRFLSNPNFSFPFVRIQFPSEQNNDASSVHQLSDFCNI